MWRNVFDIYKDDIFREEATHYTQSYKLDDISHA